MKTDSVSAVSISQKSISFLTARRTPPYPSALSLRTIWYEFGNISHEFISLLSHVSVPMTISGDIESSRVRRCGILFFTLWKLMFTIFRPSVEPWQFFRLWRLIGDEQRRGGPGLSSELWDVFVSSVVSLGLIDELESKRLDEKLGIPHWTHVQDKSFNASYIVVGISKQLMCVHISHLSHATPFCFQVTAFEHIWQGNFFFF